MLNFKQILYYVKSCSNYCDVKFNDFKYNYNYNYNYDNHEFEAHPLKLNSEEKRLIINAIKNNQKITHLYISSNFCDYSKNMLTSKDLEEIASVIEHNKSITEFSLSVTSNDLYFNQGMKALASAIKKNNNITSFSMGFVGITLGDGNIEILLNAIENNNAITSLSLDLFQTKNVFKPKNARISSRNAIVSLIKNNNTITKLNLNLGYHHLKYTISLIAKALAQNNFIRSLRLTLNDNAMTNKEAIGLVKATTKNITNLFIGFFRNKIENDGVREIIKIINKNKTLNHCKFDFSSNPISDKSLIKDIGILTKAKSLNNAQFKLSLIHNLLSNEVNNAFLLEFNEYFSCNISIKELNTETNNKYSIAIKCLKDLIKDCTHIKVLKQTHFELINICNILINIINQDKVDEQLKKTKQQLLNIFYHSSFYLNKKGDMTPSLIKQRLHAEKGYIEGNLEECFYEKGKYPATDLLFTLCKHVYTPYKEKFSEKYSAFFKDITKSNNRSFNKVLEHIGQYTNKI